jgi:hypothetical protein
MMNCKKKKNKKKKKCKDKKKKDGGCGWNPICHIGNAAKGVWSGTKWAASQTARGVSSAASWAWQANKDIRDALFPHMLTLSDVVKVGQFLGDVGGYLWSCANYGAQGLVSGAAIGSYVPIIGTKVGGAVGAVAGCAAGINQWDDTGPQQP